MAMSEEGSESLGSVAAIDTSSTYDRLPTLSSSGTPVVSQSTARQQPTAQDIQNSVDQVNTRLASVGQAVQLKVDPDSGLTVATIVNSDGDVIGQYPSTDSLHLAEMLNGWASGKNILLDLIA
jgi:uncharacterized FlaG/YvyC family protein